MAVTRAQVQTQINTIRETPDLTKAQVSSQLATWLTNQNEPVDGKTHILDDLNSYQNY